MLLVGQINLTIYQLREVMENNVSKFQMKQSHGGHIHLTLSEIASTLDVTKERVRQIEAKALNKLRKKLLAKGIKSSDLLNS